MAYEKHHGTCSGQDTGYGGSNGYQAYEGYGHASSYASSSRSSSKGCTVSGGHQGDQSKWRWNCCNCSFQNLSYNYEMSCSSCGHRRDTGCTVWAVA